MLILDFLLFVLGSGINEEGGDGLHVVEFRFLTLVDGYFGMV